MLSVVKDNPFRILGAYSDSSLRDVIANFGKIKAFSKVGREVSFPMDDVAMFEELPDRSETSIETSLASIQSDADRPKFAVFWFNSLGIDFGTSKLISGDIAGAVKQFISTIETTDINSIQNAIADKNHALSAFEVLKIYFETIAKDDQSGLAISTALSSSANDVHISYLSSLKKGDVVDGLKVITEEIDSLPVETSVHTFAELKKKYEEAKCIIANSTIGSDILVSRAYDQVCKSIRSKVISISNQSFNNIGKIEKLDFINTIKQCVAVLQAVDVSYASERIKEQYKEDLESMSNDIKGADDTYLIAIASNENICWYCGEKATHTETRTYEKKEEHSIGYNRKRVTTYTKTVKLHVCDECKKENDSQGSWGIYGAVFMLIVECGASIYYCCNTNGYGFEWKWDWIWPVVIGNIFLWWITFYIGALFGAGFRWLFYKATGRKSRHFIRTESDHPLVRRIREQGYS